MLFTFQYILLCEESKRMFSTDVLTLMTLTVGIRELAAWADSDKYMTPSSRLFSLQSTKSA
jgi:hypothetical protein